MELFLEIPTKDIPLDFQPKDHVLMVEAFHFEILHAKESEGGKRMFR